MKLHPDLQLAINHLQNGQFVGLRQALKFVGIKTHELTPEDHEEIDRQIFRCCSCRQWHGKENESDEGSGECFECSELINL